MTVVQPAGLMVALPVVPDLGLNQPKTSSSSC